MDHDDLNSIVNSIDRLTEEVNSLNYTITLLHRFMKMQQNKLEEGLNEYEQLD